MPQHTVDVAREAALDAPVFGPAALVILGYPIEHWILWGALAYGAIRLAMVLLESYWKIKDRYGRK